ncbi:MAG: hypothetical protein CL902_01890 [Dehalococcoidia bacterium]|nr:hypothetical protein [Dehalococcoidia bacterium]
MDVLQKTPTGTTTAELPSPSTHCGANWYFAHAGNEDHTRLAYGVIDHNERTGTCLRFGRSTLALL